MYLSITRKKVKSTYKYFPNKHLKVRNKIFAFKQFDDFELTVNTVNT